MFKVNNKDIRTTLVTLKAVHYLQKLLAGTIQQARPFLTVQEILLPIAIIANISWATMETTENQRTAFLHFINSKAVSAYTWPSSVKKK